MTKPITFSREEMAALPAEMLIDFLARELGPAFYNRALYDAQAVLAGKLDELGEAVLSLERR